VSEYVAICPFCASSSPNIKRCDSAFRVECQECGGTSGVAKTKTFAIAAWNKRVTLLVVKNEMKVKGEMPC
jgi:hypothetical protein